MNKEFFFFVKTIWSALAVYKNTEEKKMERCELGKFVLIKGGHFFFFLNQSYFYFYFSQTISKSSRAYALALSC